jgi:hypothetical protein
MRTVTQMPVVAPRPWGTALTSYIPSPSITRWMGGVTWVPRHCDDDIFAHGIVDPCAVRTNPAATDAWDATPVSFDPFLLHAHLETPVLCAVGDDLQGYLNEITLIERGKAMAAEIETAALTGANPSLSSSAATPTTTTDYSALGALGLVEEGLAATLSGGQGMIHLPPRLLTALMASGAVGLEGGVLRSPGGHRVVADAGTRGVPPDTTTVTAGQRWIYGSGPVYFVLADEINTLGAPWENFDYAHNVAGAHVEQYGLAYFEPCTVVAARVNVA